MEEATGQVPEPARSAPEGYTFPGGCAAELSTEHEGAARGRLPDRLSTDKMLKSKSGARSPCSHTDAGESVCNDEVFVTPQIFSVWSYLL